MENRLKGMIPPMGGIILLTFLAMGGCVLFARGSGVGQPEETGSMILLLVMALVSLVFYFLYYRAVTNECVKYNSLDKREEVARRYAMVYGMVAGLVYVAIAALVIVLALKGVVLGRADNVYKMVVVIGSPLLQFALLFALMYRFGWPTAVTHL